jgi:hypothetical protein
LPAASVAIGPLDSALVDELRTFADARILVDDDAIEYDIAPDAKRGLPVEWRAG